VTGGRIPAFRRSAFQVALLMFATFGLYVFVWAFCVRRTSAAILEREDQPIWKTIALLVPIFNLFLLFELGKRIEGVAWRANMSRTEGSLPWLGLSFFAFNVVGRLRGGYSFLGVLGFVPIAFLQRSFSRAQIALLGEAGLPAPLHWGEWILLVLGLIYWMFVGIGVTVSVGTHGGVPPDLVPWFYGSLALAIGLLVVFWFLSRRAVAEGLAMHAAASAAAPVPSA
jgi:Domain of unknown function (DUF4234)